MSLRVMEVILPKTREEEVQQLLEDQEIHESWDEYLTDERYRVKVLLPAEETEDILDKLNNQFSNEDDFRVMLINVEATIPHLKEKEEEDSEKEGEEEDNKNENNQLFPRVSREELYEDVSSSLQTSMLFVLLVGLSAVVATFGLKRNDVAIVIGAMVIAPLIGPNMGLALATTLGDTDLMKRALMINFLGFLTVLILSTTLGWWIAFDPSVFQIQTRTQVNPGDIVLALSAGMAGALAFTRGLSTVLIGVMVSVALLPPAVAAGMLLGKGNLAQAYGAGLLAFTNLVSINLSAVVTFMVQGINPVRWWKDKKAQKMTRIAVSFWIGLLVIIGILVFFQMG